MSKNLYWHNMFLEVTPSGLIKCGDDGFLSAGGEDDFVSIVVVQDRVFALGKINSYLIDGIDYANLTITLISLEDSLEICNWIHNNLLSPEPHTPKLPK